MPGLDTRASLPGLHLTVLAVRMVRMNDLKEALKIAWPVLLLLVVADAITITVGVWLG